jgi:uncharacterized membrane protein
MELENRRNAVGNHRHLAKAAMLTAFAALVGCSDDPTDPSDDDAISIAPAAEALTVAQDATGTVAITLTREGGFAGTVVLSVTNLPDGVTAEFTPAQLSGATLTAELELVVDADAEPGDYDVTVSATATDVSAATATLELTIEESGTETGALALSLVRSGPSSIH